MQLSAIFEGDGRITLLLEADNENEGLLLRSCFSSQDTKNIKAQASYSTTADAGQMTVVTVAFYTKKRD